MDLLLAFLQVMEYRKNNLVENWGKIWNFKSNLSKYKIVVFLEMSGNEEKKNEATECGFIWKIYLFVYKYFWLTLAGW